MTREQFDKAREVIKKIDAIDNEIDLLKTLKYKCNTKDWILEIRSTYSNVPAKIRHRGLLPKFLDEIFDRMNEERDALAKELEEI